MKKVPKCCRNGICKYHREVVTADEVYAKILDFTAKVNSPPTMSWLAKELGVSKETISKKVKKLNGKVKKVGYKLIID